MEAFAQSNSDFGSSCAILIGQLILEELRCLRKEIKEEVQRIADKFQDYMEAGKHVNTVPLEQQEISTHLIDDNDAIGIEGVSSFENDDKSVIAVNANDSYSEDAEIDLTECFHDIEIPHMPDGLSDTNEEPDLPEESASFLDIVNSAASGNLKENANNNDKLVNGRRMRKSKPRKIINPDVDSDSELESVHSSVEESSANVENASDDEKWLQFVTIKKNWFFCNVCKTNFTHRGSLRRHCRIHTGEKPYKCNVCNIDFMRNEDLHAHNKKMHGAEKPLPRNVEVKAAIFKLEVPKRRLKTVAKTPLKQKKVGSNQQHTTTVANQSFSGYSLNSDSNPKNNAATNGKFVLPLKHQNNVKIKNGRKFYHCDICFKSFVYTSQSYRRHMMIHTGERPFKCEFCNKGFIRSANMKLHVRVHTGEKPYNCHLCSKTFRARTNLNVHLKGAHGTDGDSIHWV